MTTPSDGVSITIEFNGDVQFPSVFPFPLDRVENIAENTFKLFFIDGINSGAAFNLNLMGSADSIISAETCSMAKVKIFKQLEKKF